MSDTEDSAASANSKSTKTVNNGDGVVIRKTISPYDITSNDNPGRYPEWWGDRPRGPMKGSGRGKPERSNNRNRGGTAKAHIAQAKAATKEITTDVPEADFGLTSDQLQTLASLLNNVKLGASHHSTEKLNDKFPFAAEIVPRQLACKYDHTLPDVPFNKNIVEDDPLQRVVTIPAVLSAPAVETTRLHDHDESNGMLPAVPIVSHIESSSPESHDIPPAVEINEEPPTTDTVENLGRGRRVKIPSTKLQDFVTNTISKICPSNCSIAPSRPSGIHNLHAPT
ncbi:unnamed protein product [Vicia faba]|uniref:Uncharacterized protein n=1 Tax=Vicia faba TaxID=3906 RepID=A0AAV0ZJX1_VICFA|nr:unnamed protein product [Vicia faba]